MRDEFKPVLRGIIAGIFFFALSLPSYRSLLQVRMSSPDLDLAFVLFVLFLPQLFRVVGVGFLTRSLIYFFELETLPRWIIEHRTYRVIRHRWKKTFFYAAVVLGILLFPVKVGHTFSEMFSPVRTLLLPVAFMDVSLFLESLILAGFALHLLKVFSLMRSSVTFRADKKIIDEKTPVRVSFHIRGPLLTPIPRASFNVGSRVSSDFLKRNVRVDWIGMLPVGYYRMDILKFEVATFPFFFSTLFKVTDNPAFVTVLPEVRVKNVPYVKNPYLVRDTGELVKKVSGSSLEFAGIREFHIGDPLSRVWWKGLAKGGKLMIKDFYAPAEDRWILVIDLSDPFISQEDESALISFARSFVEVFTRKDVEVSVHIISYTHSFTGYSRNRKSLLSFIVKHWGEFRHLTRRGAESVLRDIVGEDVKKIEKRCKSEGISLQSFLFYAGIVRKEVKLKYWSRDRSLLEGSRELLKTLNKSGKLVVLTPGMNPDQAAHFSLVASALKCPLVFVSFDRIPQHRTYLIPRENPERFVWRLMYV